MANCPIKRKSGPPGGQQQVTAGPGGATSGQQSSFQKRFKQGSDPAPHVSGNSVLYAHARRFESFLGRSPWTD